MKATMWNDILDQAGRLRAEGEPFVIATVVAYKSPQSAKPGSKAIIKPELNGLSAMYTCGVAPFPGRLDLVPGERV